MAISNYGKQPHFPIQQKLASDPRNFNRTNFLCKSLFVLAILIFLTFPFSQATGFFNHSTLSKDWGLIHSLFVSLVVSYCLITRKSVQNDVETRSHFSDSLSYASGFFNFGSGIEYGVVENSCGSSENMKIRVCNVSKFRSGFGEKKMNQALVFQYYEGESGAVTCDASYVVNECDLDKPLGLPIRNLRSSVVNLSCSGSDPKSLSKNHDKLEKGIFGDLRPVNLEKLFDECVDEAQSARMTNNDTRCAKSSYLSQKIEEKLEDDGDLEIYEVDKKAEEFIARFKYQIRLQKV